MSYEEIMICEFMLSMRGVPFSAKEASRALGSRRADKDLHWARTPLKKLVLKEIIQQTNEGYYIIPLQMEEEDEEGMEETIVFVPGDVWCGSGLAGLVPLIAVDIFSLNATETMFVTKAQAMGGPVAAVPETRLDKVPTPAAVADETSGAKPPRAENPLRRHRVLRHPAPPAAAMRCWRPPPRRITFAP